MAEWAAPGPGCRRRREARPSRTDRKWGSGVGNGGGLYRSRRAVEPGSWRQPGSSLTKAWTVSTSDGREERPAAAHQSANKVHSAAHPEPLATVRASTESGARRPVAPERCLDGLLDCFRRSRAVLKSSFKIYLVAPLLTSNTPCHN